MPDEQHEYTTLVLQVDLPTKHIDALESHLHQMVSEGKVDGFYFLTRNRAPIVHSDPDLAPETRLGYAIAAIQNDEILLHALGD